MDMKCKYCDFVTKIGEAPDLLTAGGVAMVTHMQKKHPVIAFKALNLIAPYAATFCFVPTEQGGTEELLAVRTALRKGFIDAV